MLNIITHHCMTLIFEEFRVETSEVDSVVGSSNKKIGPPET